jgi:hypothetical protein
VAVGTSSATFPEGLTHERSFVILP